MVSLAMPSHPTPGFRLRHRLPSSPCTEKNNNHHRINTEPNEQRNEPVMDLMLRSECSGEANLRLLLAALFPLADPLVFPQRHLTTAAAAALGSGGSGGGVVGGAASWSFYRCRGSAPHAAGAAPRLGAPLRTRRHALVRALLVSSPSHPARAALHAPPA